MIEASTAEGPLRLELGPHHVRLEVAQRTLHVEDELATLVDGRGKRQHARSMRLGGRLICARDLPRDDLGIWIELEGGGMRRIFGVEPVNLLTEGGLASLARLDRLAQRLRGALAPHAGGVTRAFELGRGLDKVLLADCGDRYALWARRLFRDRARLVMEVFDDGRVALVDEARKRRREFTVRSRHGVTVVGDLIRFAAPSGVDLGQIAIPWIEGDDRRELARRIGQLVDRETGEPAPDGGGFGIAPSAPPTSGKRPNRLRWLIPGRFVRR